MSLRERFRRWQVRRRRKRAARRHEASALREFVYLDEVSVFSLISSRLGPVATEFTATESSSLTGELTGTAGVSAGVLKSELKARSEATQTHGTQVLRKATVQATFKELYEYVEDGFVLRPAETQPPDVRSARDLETALEYSRAGGWVTRASELTRGQLSEIEVELEAEDIFRVGAMVDIYLGLFQEAPELLGPDVREQFRQALSVNVVLNKLLAGLVPVRGRAVDYMVVRTVGEEWVVHKKVLQQFPADWVTQAHALDVVAVAEASLFWKDIRRVLFSGSRYSLLCRIGRDGLNDEWTPVKLADVIRGFSPAIADQLDAAGGQLAAAMSRDPAEVPAGYDNQTRMRKALQAYGHAVAAHYNQAWDPSLITEDVFPAAGTRSWATLEEQRPPFEALTHRLRETFDIDPDRELIADFRYQALVRDGLVPLVRSVANVENSAPVAQPAKSESRILDTELIAVYW